MEVVVSLWLVKNSISFHTNWKKHPSLVNKRFCIHFSHERLANKKWPIEALYMAWLVCRLGKTLIEKNCMQIID